jgi:hypothetical protein
LRWSHRVIGVRYGRICILLGFDLVFGACCKTNQPKG